MNSNNIVKQLKKNQLVQIYIFQDYDDKLYISKICEYNQQQQFLNELSILSQVQHPHIIKLVDSKDNQLILEYCKNRDLYDYVNIQAFPQTIARFYFRQMISTIEYLHDQNICHRDIKLDNIVLDNEFDIKFIDFGFAKKINANQKLSDQLGTEGYMAPELFQKVSYDPKAADIFALGVLLFQLAFAVNPFSQAKENDSFYKYIYYGQLQSYWDKVFLQINNEEENKDLIQLLSFMFCKNPKKRWSINQIKQSAWLNQETASKQEVQKYMKQIKLKINYNIYNVHIQNQ